MSALSKEIAPAPPRAAKSAKAGGQGSGSGRGRMLEIDGYRALAALAIIIIHAWMQSGWLWQGQNATTYLLRGMDAAVALFFALSGLVTFMPMVRGALTGKIPSGKEFLVRRLYRILTLYFFLVLVVWSSRYA